MQLNGAFLLQNIYWFEQKSPHCLPDVVADKEIMANKHETILGNSGNVLQHTIDFANEIR